MRSVKSIVPAIVSIVLAARSLAAAESPVITGTGYLIGVPVPGILSTNAAGEVSLKGNVHVLRVEADDPRLTGRAQATMDTAYQADGSGLFSGMTYQEVGTWDLTDPLNPMFTPAGGLWQMTYRGLAAVDGSSQVQMAGYGIGGTIDGLRVEETLTRGAGAPFDPAIPYVGTATIKPAPAITTVGLDFASWSPGDGNYTWIVSNHQLKLGGSWPGIHTTTGLDTTAWGVAYEAWGVPNGQTLEARVDLVSLNAAATAALLALYHADGQCYGVAKEGSWVAIFRQSYPGVTWFCADQVPTRNTNVVLVLALAPVGENVIITAKVVDTDSGAVLYHKSIADTPASDVSLSAAELAQITGGTVLQGVVPDPAGAPWTNGTAPFLGVYQDTDGTKPAAEGTFANFELRTYEVPQLSIERAVRLTWPAPVGVNWAVEAAPAVEGPWLPFQDLSIPGMQQVTVPANTDMQFFRLR